MCRSVMTFLKRTKFTLIFQTLERRILLEKVLLNTIAILEGKKQY